MSIDEIYTLPVSRSEFFINKLVSVIIQVLVFMVFNIIFILLGFITAGPMPYLGDFFGFMGMTTLLFIIIAIFGFALAIIIKRGAKAMISLVIPLPLYVIYFIYQLTDNKVLANLKYLSRAKALLILIVYENAFLLL